jgi:hypothetical protein
MTATMTVFSSPSCPQPKPHPPQIAGAPLFPQGANPDRHYDNPATIPASGLDLLANICSGPYRLDRGDTLVFYTVCVAGTNKKTSSPP